MHSPRTRFLILGMARSGTTITHQALQGHPNVRSCMDELKPAPFFTQGIACFTVGGHNPFERNHGYGLLLDALTLVPCAERGPHVMGYGGPETHPKGEVLANGAKVAVASAEEAAQVVDALQSHASLRDVAIVLVERSDLVAQHASLLRAKRSGRWHSFHTKAAPGPAATAPFSIPVPEFEAYCEDACRTKATFERLLHTHRVHHVSYDREIAPAGRDAFGSLFAFLGLPPIQPTWIYSEKVAPPVAAFVENAAALYDRMRQIVPPRSAGDQLRAEQLASDLERNRDAVSPVQVRWLVEGLQQLNSLHLVHVLRARGETELARLAAARVPAGHANHGSALVLLAEIHLDAGELADAERLLEQALAVDAAPVDVHLRLAWLRWRQCRHAEGLAAAERLAAALASRDAAPYLRHGLRAVRANLLRSSGRLDEAIGELEQLTRENPENPQNFEFLALLRDEAASRHR